MRVFTSLTAIPEETVLDRLGHLKNHADSLWRDARRAGVNDGLVDEAFERGREGPPLDAHPSEVRRGSFLGEQRCFGGLLWECG